MKIISLLTKPIKFLKTKVEDSMNWISSIAKLGAMLPVIITKIISILADHSITIIEIIGLLKSSAQAVSADNVKVGKIGKQESIIIKEIVSEIVKALEDQELTVAEIFAIIEKIINVLGLSDKTVIKLSDKK